MTDATLSLERYDSIRASSFLSEFAGEGEDVAEVGEDKGLDMVGASDMRSDKDEERVDVFEVMEGLDEEEEEVFRCEKEFSSREVCLFMFKCISACCCLVVEVEVLI